MTERIVCVKCGREGHRSRQCKRPEAAYESKFHGTAETMVQTVLLVLLAHPEGVTAVETAAMLGRGVDSILHKLRVLRDRGEAGTSHVGGCKALWLLADLAAVHRLEHAARKRREATEMQARRNERRRQQAAAERWSFGAALAEIDALEAQGVDTDPVIRRIIPAHMAQPLQVAGPRWVFDLAAA